MYIYDQFNCHDHQKQQTKNKEKSTQIPLVKTYNQTLLNFRKTLSDNWSLLNINNRLKHIFKEEPIIAYSQNKRHYYRKQQSSQKTEADIKKWLL